MKKTSTIILGIILLSFILVSTAFAQAESLTLKLSRDWGYGGLNGDIEGLFSMRVTGPTNLAKVEYYIDTIKIGEVSHQPFNFQFTTDKFENGIHRLSAVGFSANGQVYRSKVISANFVPKQSPAKIILPVVGVILLAILLSALVPFLAGRGRSLSMLPFGTERTYGAGGGGICPNCHRPFALPFFSAHFGLSKMAVCPFCGKLGLVRQLSIERLRDAEKAELAQLKSELKVENAKDEEMSKEIDESKYMDT
jgi:hypothetical protein